MATTTVGALRAGDEVRAVLPDGSLGFSTVFVLMHRKPLDASHHVVLRVATANRTLRASPEHLLPLARGGVGACAASAAAQPMLPAGAAAVGDALWVAAADGAHGWEDLACSPITAVGRDEVTGYASPMTFAGTLLVEGVAASVWSNPFHPLAISWRRARQAGGDEGGGARGGAATDTFFFFDPEADPRARAVRFLFIDAPFRALYLVLAAARTPLPAAWQAAAADAADDFTAACMNAYLDFLHEAVARLAVTQTSAATAGAAAFPAGRPLAAALVAALAGGAWLRLRSRRPL